MDIPRRLLFCAVGCFLIAAPARAQIIDSVDVFTGDHYIHSDTLRELATERFEGYEAGIKAVYTKRSDAGTRWSVELYAYSERGTTLRDAREMLFVADDERVQPYDTERDIYREQWGAYTLLVEKQTGLFKRSAYETLAAAESVRVKVGDAIFTLPQEALRDMQLILDEVPKYQSSR